MGVIINPDGRRFEHEGQIIATEDWEGVLQCYQFCKAIRRHNTSGHIAHIGLGFGVLAWMLGPRYAHTYFELVPVPKEHQPPWGKVVEGNYLETLYGTYDVVVYDLGEPADVQRIRPHVAPGGLFLGVAHA